jgi:hypothetical protein
VRFGEYHMDISVGLLAPVSKFFTQNPKYKGHFPIDTKTNDELGTMFKYRFYKGECFP